MALTKKQKVEIENTMRARRALIAAELQQDVEKVRGEPYSELAGGSVTDLGDQASADVMTDVTTAELSRDLRELQALDAALARMNEPDFGTCTGCGAEITFERLRAAPSATRCFDCQRVHEKTYAHPTQAKL